MWSLAGNHCGCSRDATASRVTRPIAHASPLIVCRAAARPCSAIASTSTPRYVATRPSSIVLRSALSDQPVASPIHSAKPAEQADRDPARGADPRRQDPGERREQDDPPHRDPDLAAHDRVVAAVAQREIGDERERQRPCRDRRGVDALGEPPLDGDGNRPLGRELHRGVHTCAARAC